MNAGEVMTSPVVTVPPDASLGQVARLLLERHISGVPVLEGERLVGLVSEADLLRARQPGAQARRAKDVMTREVAAVAPDTPVAEVAMLLEARGIKRVPVLREGRLVGIVSRSNLVQALALKEPAGEARAGDDAIRSALRAQLEPRPWWHQSDSKLMVADGVVHYWGALRSEEERVAARAVAETIPGVRRVEDHRFAVHGRARPATEVRRAAQRGHSKHGAIEAWHSFSYGNYYDPAHMGFGPMRALNEKVVQPGAGSTTYGLRDVEVVTCVLEGAFGHDDSMDNRTTLLPGGVQRISAGSGMRHSEHNRADAGVTRFLQIWIEPDRAGLPASYDQRHFSAEDKHGHLALMVSPDGRDGSLSIRQDVLIYAGNFDGAERAQLDVALRRLAYVQVARGSIAVNGQTLDAGDGVACGSGSVTLEHGQNAEVLVFDLPGSLT
jgi:redox-sensitive bicupin YhaK (pirin superfamily)/CBS domain-containing protein